MEIFLGGGYAIFTHARWPRMFHRGYFSFKEQYQNRPLEGTRADYLFALIMYSVMDNLYK